MSFLLVILFLYVLFIDPYRANTDEALQLQAAMRLADGHGYTATLIPQHDLSVANDSYLKEWPVGYSFFISVLIKLGFSLDFSAKLFKGIVLVFGLWLWIKLFESYFKNSVAKISCISLLCPLSLRFASSTTDLVLWTVFPLLTLLMLSIRRSRFDVNGIGIKKQKVFIFTASILISMAILVKYLGLVLLPICFVWLAFMCQKKRKELITDSLLLILLPIVTTIIIFYTNTLYAGSIGTIGDHINKHLGIHFNLLEMFEAILHVFIPQGLLIIIVNKLNLAGQLIMIVNILATGIAFAIGYVLYKLYRIRHPSALMSWFILSFVSLVLFLSFLTLLFWNGTDFKLLSECRYYYFVSPIIIMFVMDFVFSIMNRRVTRIFTVFILVIGMAGSWSYSIYRSNRSKLNYHVKSIVPNSVNVVRSSDTKASILVIANDTKYNLLFQQQGIPSYSVQSDKFLNKGTFFSKPTWLFVVCDVESACPGGMSEAVEKLSFKNITYSEATIYWRKFETGRLFSQESSIGF